MSEFGGWGRGFWGKLCRRVEDGAVQNIRSL